MDKNSQSYIAQKKFLQTQSDIFFKNSNERKTINYLWIWCSSINHDDTDPRTPASNKIMDYILESAKNFDASLSIETKFHLLDEIKFDHCEANYSMKWEYCTWPCWITQRMAKLGKADPLSQLYDDLIDRADVVIIATPIRRWNASSLYYKLIERLNCIENQKEVYGVNLVHNKLVWMVIIWAQDGAQHVMWQIMSVWAELGFAFAKSPYVAYTAWWLRNDKTELVQEQIQHDRWLIEQMTQEMISNQISTILQRKKYMTFSKNNNHKK